MGGGGGEWGHCLFLAALHQAGFSQRCCGGPFWAGYLGVILGGLGGGSGLGWIGVLGGSCGDLGG